MTANLKAPIVINADTRKGCQVIVENHDYKVKYPVYERFAKAKQEKEGGVYPLTYPPSLKQPLKRPHRDIPVRRLLV